MIMCIHDNNVTLVLLILEFHKTFQIIYIYFSVRLQCDVIPLQIYNQPVLPVISQIQQYLFLRLAEICVPYLRKG